MRFYLLMLILMSSKVYCQPLSYVKEVDLIASSERHSHARLMNKLAFNAAASSNNFDVKYYRCEWQVDPAVRFIKGKVTVYFIITSATNTISFDLMDSLITDSVKQQNTLLQNVHK